MTSIDERLARNPFAKDGLDAAYLRQIEHRTSFMRRPGYWPDRDTLDHSCNWVAIIARPTRDSGFAPEELGRRQQEWDDAAARFRDYLAAHTEGTRRRHAVAAERERQRQEQTAADELRRLEALTERLRRGYFTIPGATEADFRRDLPDLLAEERRRAALGTQAPASPISITEIMNPGDLDAA